MSKAGEPEISSAPQTEDYTCITFHPDLRKFKMQQMDDDIVSLLTKRAYDLAGVSDSKVRVFLNGKRLEVKNFVDYCDLYLQNEENKDLPKIIEAKQARWEVIASLSDGQFQQVSFVNAISTSKGGTHVAYITDQIVQRIQAAL
jgi:DNA topoisomerase-2